MLIAFSGFKGSGKDTAAKILVEEYGFTKVAFADAVREMALTIDPYISIPANYGKLDESFNVAMRSVRLSELVKNFGWDQIKREITEVRRLLQVIGTEAGRMLFGPNVWINILDKRFPDLSDSDTRYVITDCRFENEVSFVKDQRGQVIWIDRPGLISDGHASESDVARKNAWIITNDTSIAQLQEDVRFLMHLRGIDSIDKSK